MFHMRRRIPVCKAFVSLDASCLMCLPAGVYEWAGGGEAAGYAKAYLCLMCLYWRVPHVSTARVCKGLSRAW